MKIKKLLLVCMSVVFITACTSTKVEDDKKTNNLKVKYSVEKISDNFDYLKSSISFPQFDDIPVLNKTIKNSVENYYDSFKRYAESDWKELAEIRAKDNAKLPPFDYNVSFEVSQTSDFISVLLRTYIYDGGAHGSTNLSAYNFSKKNNKFVNIVEATGLSYKELSQYCNAELTKKFLKDNSQGISDQEIKEWVNEGTFPTPDNYEIFMIYDKYVTVYFEEYTVAPYAFGEQSVKVPFNTSGQGTLRSSP